MEFSLYSVKLYTTFSSDTELVFTDLKAHT